VSTHIIQALRHQSQLKANTFLIATELAHRMNGSGYGRVSYQYLAWKAHCCRRTAITQVKKLLDLGLIRKTVIRTREGYAWNLYQYIGPRIHTASPPVTTHGATSVRTLPEDQREKELSRRQEIDNQRKMLRYMTEGSRLWHRTMEELTRLLTLERT